MSSTDSTTTTADADASAASSYQSVLEEAQQLMDDIDIDDTEGVAASFTIDDDDDDDVFLNQDDEINKSNQHPLSTAPVLDDPLSQLAMAQNSPEPLRVETGRSPTTAPTVTNQYYTASSSVSPQYNQQQQQQHLQMQYQMQQQYQQQQDSSSSSSAGLKQQAQRFGNDAQRMAASVLNLAQKAAHGIATGGAGSSNSNINGMTGNNRMMPSPVNGGAPSPHNGMATSAAATSPMAYSAAASMPAVVAPELDKDQKLRLLQSAVKLLEGEQVIMFLHPLLHASDSSGLSYYYNNNGNSNGGSTTVMSCAMTFYRVILFEHEEPTAAGMENGDDGSSTAQTVSESSVAPLPSQPPPMDWNPSCWATPRRTKLLLQIPLSSLERVEKSVFSTMIGGGGANSMALGNGLSNTPTSMGVSAAAASSSTSMMGLVLTGKDNQRVLRMSTANYQDTIRAHQALQTYAFPGRRNLGYLFAFESRRQEVMNSLQQPSQQPPAAGPESDASINPQQQLQQPPVPAATPVITCEPTRARFTLSEFQRQLAPGKHPWMIYPTLNHQYQLCSSYPGMLLAGPASLNVETNVEAKRLVQQCAHFRSEHRLPVLTWSSGTDGASLWRASQPKVGLQGNRSSADELLLKHILESAASANAMQYAPGSIPQLRLSQIQALTGNNLSLADGSLPPQPSLKILDLRPRSAAMANRTGGYGYENTSNYAGTTLQFCGIDNIHKVRDAYQKLSAVCMSPTASDLNWNALVEDTKWPSMIRLILAAAWESAFWIHVYRYPVLLHCSHGWDRTSQVAALAQLFLDPFYRTREGFSTLVEKDFMSFGHPFHTRCAHGEGRGDSGSTNITGAPSIDEGQISPIFIQFLDCVFQLVNQYPECFEFNTKYMLVISEHVYSCRFGTFLCDTERERELVAGIRQRTNSLWDYLDSRQDVVNHTFNAKQAGGVMLMPLPTLLRNVTLWADRHCMHGPKATTRWLPPDIDAPTTDFETDQHGSLVTAHDMQARVLSVASGLAASHTGGLLASTDEAAKDEDTDAVEALIT